MTPVLTLSFEWASKEASGKSERKRQQIIEWLEAVRADLNELSTVWIKLCSAVDERRNDSLVAEAECLLGLPARGRPQLVVAERLRSFYKSASIVLGGRVDGHFQQTFTDQLGTVLHHRDIARSGFDRQMQIQLLDHSNRESDINTMQAAAKALQKELVALEVLITNFKATQ